MMEYKIIENHPNDSRVKYREDNIFQTLSSRMGTGGGNVPMVHTIAGNIINRADKNGGHQMGVGEDVSFTLNTVDRHAVAITGETFFQCTDDDTSPTLKARDYKEPIAVCPIPQKTVRCLTPIECERLQGWPDNYTNVPLNGKPATDAARYKALGNGMAQPCARWIIQRIADVNSKPTTELRRIYMQIKKLHLENFRGIKELDLDLTETVTIYGPNGSGKTTVANAISWLLTDQPITGEKDFTPKTEGTHNLNHVAEMTLTSQDGDIVLKKDFHEIWKKKRGSKSPEFAGHETEYFVNGVPHKKKDYETVVETFCNTRLENIPMMIRVGFFAEDMKMEARRKVLFDVLGDIKDEDVIKQAGLEKLNEILLVPGADDGKKYSPEEYMAIAKNRRREINKKLDEIPARIDELTKTLPEEEETQEKGKKRSNEIVELEGMKQAILSTPADNKTAALRAVIAGYRTEIEKGRETYLKEANDENKGTLERIRAIQNKITDAKKTRIDAIANMDMASMKISKLNSKREDLLRDFEKLKAQKWDPAQEICPTCGQNLPEDKVNDLRHEFLAKLSAEKERINEAGKMCSKELIAKATEEKAKWDKAIDDTDAVLEQLNNEYEKENEQLKTPPPYEETDQYQEAAAKIAEMEAQLTDETAVPKENPELKEIDEKLTALRKEEATFLAAKGTRKRIDYLETEKQELGAELDKTDAGIAMVEDFYRAKVSLVTEKIDSEFETIKFLLFKEQINGGLKEVCEPMIPDKEGNLVEYKSANTAAQVNAGLEIIKVLSDHYGVYMPVVLDRAESVTTPIEMPRHQLIKLKVTKGVNKLEIQKEG